MKTIYLIRHGEKVGELGDPVLTELGHKQAELSGKYFKQFPITHIIASPYSRTKQTARGINQSLNLEVLFDDRLIERMNWEDEHVTFKEFLQEWFKATNNRGYVPAWGDSSSETGKRVAEVVSDLDDDTHTILVSHGGAIVDFLRSTFGDEALKELIKESPLFGLDYKYKHCGITKIIIREDDSDQLNDDNHVIQPKLELLHFLDHLDI